jgi:hypothetical protein
VVTAPRIFAAAVGDGTDLVRWQTGAPADDLRREYATAAARVLAPFGAPGALDRDFTLGRRPGWPGDRRRYR